MTMRRSKKQATDRPLTEEEKKERIELLDKRLRDLELDIEKIRIMNATDRHRLEEKRKGLLPLGRELINNDLVILIAGIVTGLAVFLIMRLAS